MQGPHKMVRHLLFDCSHSRWSYLLLAGGQSPTDPQNPTFKNVADLIVLVTFTGRSWHCQAEVCLGQRHSTAFSIQCGLKLRISRESFIIVVPWNVFAFMLVAVLLAWFYVCSLNHFELL